MLQTFVAVRDDEIGTLLWACLFLFGLLAGNYLIRPIRDDMGIAGGTAYLPALFTGTLVAMLVVWPWLSARLGPTAGPAELRTGLSQSSDQPRRVLRRVPASAFIGAGLGRSCVLRLGQRFQSAGRLHRLGLAGRPLHQRPGASPVRFHRGRGSPRRDLRIEPRWPAGDAGGAPLSDAAGRGLPGAPMLAARRLFASSSSPNLNLNLNPNRTRRPWPIRRNTTSGRSGRSTWSDWDSGRSCSRSARHSSTWSRLGSSRASIEDPAARTAFFARIDLLVNLLSLALQVFVTGWCLALLGAGGRPHCFPP